MPIADILANNSFVEAPAAAAAVSTATAWKQLIYSERETGEDYDPNNLETSISDTGGEIVFAGSLYGSTPLPYRCASYYWIVVDPDTGSTVTWTDGDFVAVEFWADFGTQLPDVTNAACWFGLFEDGATDASQCGIYVTTGNQVRLGASTWTATSNQTTTWGSDDILFGNCDCLASTASSSAVILDGSRAVQFDDAASPIRVVDITRNTGYSVVSGDLRINLGFSGDVDVAIYYRLIKTPVAPS